MVIFSNLFFICLGSIVVLRLFIWQFLRGTEPFFVEDFSNITVSAVIFFFASLWGVCKFLRKDPLQKSYLEIPILLLFLGAACSLFYTVDFSSTLKGVLVLGSQIIFFYMLLDVLLKRPSRIKGMLTFLLGLTFIVAAYGIFEFFILWMRPALPEDSLLQLTNNSLYYILLKKRVVSFLGWPNSLAGYLLLFLPLALVLPFYFKETWKKSLSMLTLFVFLVCFLYTFSFLGWMSFILSTGIMILVFKDKLNVQVLSKEKQRMVLYAFLTFFILFLWVILRKDFISSLIPRVAYYKAAFLLLGKNFVLGYGLDSFKTISRPFITGRLDLSAYVHNSYLQSWLEAGLLGFCGIVSLAVTVIVRGMSLCKERIKEKGFLLIVAIVWGLLAFLIDNLFNFTILKSNISFYFWTMLAVFCAMHQSGKPPVDEKKVRKGRLLIGGGCFVFVFTLFILLRMHGAYTLYYQAKYGEKARDYQGALYALNKAKVLDPWNDYLPAAVGELRLKMFSDTRQNSFLKEAIIDYSQAVERSPLNYSHHFILSRIYSELGDYPNEILFNHRAEELSPFEFVGDIKAVQQNKQN